MTKLIHIYRKNERLCDIAFRYGVDVYQMLSDNFITNVDYLEDFTPLVINTNIKCSELEQLYCNEERRGCYGCYYFK